MSPVQVLSLGHQAPDATGPPSGTQCCQIGGPRMQQWGPCHSV